MLSDQDTIYPSNYIKDMLLSIVSYSDKVAAIAPLCIDVNRNNKNPGFLKESFAGEKIYPTNGIHEIYQAIASEMIINTKYIEEIGFMDENLFIDWFDLEWFWRANRKGYNIIGNVDVKINHQLGDSVRKIVFTEIFLRNPTRSYYVTRNTAYISLRSQSIKFLYKIFIFMKSIRYAIMISILANPNLEHFKMAIKGFCDGVVVNWVNWSIQSEVND